MKRILITGIGGDISCAIVRCLLENGAFNTEIYGVDIKEYTPYMNRIRKTFVAPRYTDIEYLPFIKKIIIDNNITHYLPTSEQEIIIANNNRSFFESNGVLLLINNEEIINICTSKYKTADFLDRHGVDVPKTYYADKYKGGIEYPFVMKSDMGCGSKGLRIIHNDDEWMSAEKEGMVCQQMVGSSEDEFTVGVFSDGFVINTITMKRQLGYGGLSVFVQCCDIPQVDDIALRVAQAFNLKGSFNIQLRRDGGKYYIFEINPRLSSTTGFRHKMGFKDVIWWLEMLDGRKIPKYLNEAVGLVGVKVLDDIIIDKV